MNGQEEWNANGHEDRGTKRKCNGALDHVLVESDTACRGADGTKSNLCATRAGGAQRSWARTEGQG
jgi:hypothetical protein